MEKYIYIAIGAALLIFIIYSVVTTKKRLRTKLLARVRASWGALPDREYTEEELKKIRTYFETVKSEDDFCIDDITWNDLNMDVIFSLINQTFSSVGEEVLYDILRRPAFSEEELEERDRVITYFEKHSDVREAFSVDYASIGRTKKYSLIEFLGMFRKLTTAPDIIYILHMLLIPAAVVLAILQPLTGVVVLIFAVIFNLITYYRQKARIEPYYVSLTAMAYLVNAAERIASHNVPDLKNYLNVLKEETKPVHRLSGDIRWLGNGSVGTSMDLIQVILDYLRMITHVDFLIFNRMVKRIINNEDHLLNLIRTMGFLEAMIAVASYRQVLPFFTTGEFTQEKGMDLTDGYHPLIKEPVANSIHETRSMLITGSNASGKSTFLRMTALSALMAQTICTIPAHTYRAPFFRIYSSMALRDDIQSAESYFIVEIRSMKRIMDAAAKEGPAVLCFVDEVLRGTNTVERIAASSQILKELIGKNAYVFAATHDIELTQLLKDQYANYHFTETVEDDQVSFSYKLLPGSASSRNAIRLLSVMGYDEEVVERAQKEAEHFTAEGVWKLM